MEYCERHGLSQTFTEPNSTPVCYRSLQFLHSVHPSAKLPGNGLSAVFKHHRFVIVFVRIPALFINLSRINRLPAYVIVCVKTILIFNYGSIIITNFQKSSPCFRYLRNLCTIPCQASLLLPARQSRPVRGKAASMFHKTTPMPGPA